ncbi:putative c6 zinc finger domain protein [Eutypa lata UCREL1]|uniref:Putative c6 zinc finger domain protein n=1 Tax=Eutypa lata (strain UCR-EL1) TaxID=1287681 RepID=M7SJS7_EUTLA|nr:putative c6 zinc finger domain protein [Eutypa lata UCREL1]
MELRVLAPDAATGQNQHCWECRRRRLVCDATRPVCKKCQDSKIVCPGYDEKQPLRWLKPGRVTCRTRKSKAGGGGSRKDAAESGEGSDVNHVYQSVSPLHKIAQKYEEKPFPMSLLHYFPESQRHGFVSIAMAHRLYRLPEGTSKEFEQKARSITYQYRGMAIRALNQEIGSEATAVSNALIASTITLLAADLQLSSASVWRFHFDGVVAMIKLAPDVFEYERVLRQGKNLTISYRLEGFGNTTSPRWNQSTAVTEPDIADMVFEIYGDRVLPLYVGTLCPRPLFMNVLTINYLRRGGVDPTAVADPSDLLEDINDFAPADWVEGKATPDTRPQWLLLGCIYQSAVALYCIMSLQSVGLLPSTLETVALDASHYERLMQLLRRGLAYPHLRHSVTWPLVVAGIRAASGSRQDRHYVIRELSESARVGGTALPLQAKEVLERYWASGSTNWDDCFDRPYVWAA